MTDLSVRKVKTFRGMEGLGFNAELWNGERKLAFVIDHGDGGSPLFEWARPEDRDEIVNWIGEKSIVDLGLAKTLDEEIEGMKLSKLYDTAHAKFEAYVNHLVDEHKEQRRMRRLFKTNVIFDIDGKRYQYPLRGRTREWVEQCVKAKYPEALFPTFEKDS